MAKSAQDWGVSEMIKWVVGGGTEVEVEEEDEGDRLWKWNDEGKSVIIEFPLSDFRRLGLLCLILPSALGAVKTLYKASVCVWTKWSRKGVRRKHYICVDTRTTSGAVF
jgi:hypothetical protein